jgi:acyl carrier protein
MTKELLMSDVTFEQFKVEFANELDIQDADCLDLPLADIKEYDSMGKLMVAVLIERLFGVQIEYDDLEAHKTLDELYRRCLSFKN